MKLAATGLIVLTLTALTGCWRYNEPYGSASPYSESRKACEANGGTWDFKSATCQTNR
jgi:hypothetical protein